LLKKRSTTEKKLKKIGQDTKNGREGHSLCRDEEEAMVGEQKERGSERKKKEGTLDRGV